MENENVIETVSQEAAAPAEQQAEQLIPEVCRYKVLHGKSGKPLYFEHEDGRCFDCDLESWLEHKPAVAKELSSRPITISDFLYAILHGLVDRPTYDILLHKGLVTEESRRAFEKLEKISNDLHQAALLNKSEEESSYLEIPDNYFDDALKEDEDEMFDEDLFEQGVEEQGTDVVAEIMALAHKFSVDPRLEDIIRQIVREELSSASQPEQAELLDEQDL